MKIHLIYFDLNVGYIGLHNGLAYIIGMLDSLNYEVTLHCLSKETDIIGAFKKINSANPEIVGLSFTTNQKQYVRKFLEQGKINCKLLIAGGAHCTFLKENTFSEFPELDGICIGEGEFALKELCAKFKSNANYYHTPSFYFKKDNEIIKNPIMPLTKLDSLPLPKYDLFDYEKAIEEGNNSLTMMVSRGCPFNCSYCGNHLIRLNYPNSSEYVRFHTVPYAMKLVKHNLRLSPKIKRIYFGDDIFVLNKSWLSDFCKEYKNEIGLPFGCTARIETLNEDVIKILKESGCVLLKIGIESGSEWLRKNVLNRNYTNQQVKEVFKLIKKYKIPVHTFNIFGFPFETKQMAHETIRLNLEIEADTGKCFFLYPYPNTKIYNISKEYNLIDEIAFEKASNYLENPILKETHMSHEETRKCLEKLQYYFYFKDFLKKYSIPYLKKLIYPTVIILRWPLSKFLHSKSKTLSRIKSLISLGIE